MNDNKSENVNASDSGGLTADTPKDELTGAVGRMRSEGIRTLFGVISNEANELKLDMQKRALLRETLGADAAEAGGWSTAADVIKRFDSVELIRKYPDQAKSTLLGVLSVFPPTMVASMLLRSVPSETLSKIMGVSLTASPDHLLHMLAEHQANASAERRAGYMLDEPGEEGKTDLITVCQDDLLYSQLKKLVESRDDESDDIIVGVKDGTVRLVRWEEKKWAFRHKNDTIRVRSLIIGDVKGSEDGKKLMEVKFDRFGVRYGWVNGCAYITADRAALRSKGKYEEFLNELGGLPVPGAINKNSKLKLNVKTGLKLALATPLIAKDIYDDSRAVLRQMYFYGVMRFYYDHLDEFLKS